MQIRKFARPLQPANAPAYDCLQESIGGTNIEMHYCARRVDLYRIFSVTEQRIRYNC